MNQKQQQFLTARRLPRGLSRTSAPDQHCVTSVTNQKLLEKNRTNGGEMMLNGPAREGLALLQGLLVCGHCGRSITVRYTGSGGIYPCYQCNWLHRVSDHVKTYFSGQWSLWFSRLVST
jgi:hypothetical protein